MADLFHAANRADRQAARQLLPQLSSGHAVTRKLLNDAMVALEYFLKQKYAATAVKGPV